MNPPAVRPLARHSHEDINNLMNLNAGFPTQLTRTLWPLLANNSPSLVMNVSSAASLGFPYATIYSGSKAFLESFTHALYAEAHAESHDVEVMGIVVGAVTDVSHRKEPVSLLTPNATTMARAALGKVGCGRAVVAGFWMHGLQVGVFGLLPEWVLLRVKGNVMRDLGNKEKARMQKES
ncbi:hypothetical protein MMC08_002794 [Hypocenomyce scalaris]|nr:hypothetical protein [Hypocenomyce scalaris]